ncbi:MAG: NTP transferase domain-containing protein [Lachnospiraceae bacterium]|nr:NTP transferase domain-containing protein [Lachnospiraceae bacterium]
MKNTALIMAGGRGERFWPRSRKNLPKQFLSLTSDGKTLIQLTVERILPLVGREDMFISTNEDYLPLVRQQLPDIPEENIICEPVSRNTAPGIGLGAAYIAKKYGEETVMIVLPSDHLIKYNQMFAATLRDAVQLAEKGQNLVTLGITPDEAETGYGYIKFRPDEMEDRGYRVDHFAEKPSLELAKEYVSSDEYLWNSGIFVWKVSTIMKEFERFMPDVHEGLSVIRDAVSTSQEEEIVRKIYPGFPSISIDYGIMEKSDRIYTIPGNFGWDDVGSWLAIERIQRSNEYGNISSGNVITVNTGNCIIQGRDKLIAMVGMEDTIVVDTEDATLICAKNSTADIKKVLENLKICNRDEYL